MTDSSMKQVLLHICCAPCGGYVIKELQKMGYQVTAYFFNPNIYPEAEYNLRLSEVEKYCKKEKVKLIQGKYNYQSWKQKVRAYTDEPEKGKRCEVCITLRLGETAQLAAEKGYEAIASTLLISPHKSENMVNQIGQEMAELYGLEFIAEVWRKNEGFKKACELAEAEHFLRQDYCGCEYSMRK